LWGGGEVHATDRACLAPRRAAASIKTIFIFYAAEITQFFIIISKKQKPFYVFVSKTFFVVFFFSWWRGPSRRDVAHGRGQKNNKK
jgi:hypothetical protein